MAGPPTLSGALRRTRSGPVHVLLLLTGLALVKWLARGALALLGYRHSATLTIGGASLELAGERRLLGLSLGRTRLVIPLRSLESVRLAASSPTWALVVAVACLVAAAFVATTLVIWGLLGREPGWILLGLAVLALGVLLDGGAYLLVRRARGGAQFARLEIVAARDRVRLCRVPLPQAERVLEVLSRQAGGKWSA